MPKIRITAEDLRPVRLLDKRHENVKAVSDKTLADHPHGRELECIAEVEAELNRLGVSEDVAEWAERKWHGYCEEP
jgi:hypothetical protein